MNGMILSVPSTGGCPAVLAVNQPGVGGVAVDDTYVYWSVTSAPTPEGGVADMILRTTRE